MNLTNHRQVLPTTNDKKEFVNSTQSPHTFRQFINSEATPWQSMQRALKQTFKAF